MPRPCKSATRAHSRSKRAKTDDEKEQRRIERVLRNRQAAQSSRERKRQEVEKLEGERDVINQQNVLLRQRLLKVEEEKFKLQQELGEMRALVAKHTGGELTPSATPSPLLRSAVFDEQAIKQELDELPLLPTRNAIDPLRTLAPTPAPLDLADATPSLDLTQHPAAMLCRDLQCQSTETSPPASPQPPSAAQPAPETLLPFLMAHSIAFSTVTTPLCQLLASLKKGSRLRTKTITPTLFTLILWLISTPPSPHRPTPTAAATRTTRTPSTFSPSMAPSSTFRTSLLRRFLACSPALARPLKDATAAALHAKARYALRESSDDEASSPVMASKGGTASASRATAKAEVWRLMTMALVIDQWEKDRLKKGKPDKGLAL